jgi:type IV secretory pathway TraG/TraD family ATPase VirD4
MKSGQSIVLTDIKPELYGILKAMNADENFGYKIWVINPLDPYADSYNIFSEAESVADLTEIINILMTPENKDSIVFYDGAKNILLGVLLRMKEKSLSISLPNALDYIRDFDDISDLLRDLANSNDKTVQKIESEISESSGNKNLFASVLNALSKAFNFLNTEVIRDSILCNADQFNLKEVLMKPKQIVILQYEMQYKELTKTLLVRL